MRSKPHSTLDLYSPNFEATSYLQWNLESWLAATFVRCVYWRCSLISPNRSPSWVYCRAPTEIKLGLGLELG